MKNLFNKVRKVLQRNGVTEGVKGINSGLFKRGDKVKIRSKEEIQETLDIDKQYKGCLFTPNMWSYCGKEYTVLKRVNHLLDEALGKMIKSRGNIYILDGVFCDGIVDSFQRKCDRTCFLFWDDRWLTRVK